MKKYYFLLIIYIIILFFGCSNDIQLSVAYWGEEGDCRDYHGITYFKAAYDKDALIALDGNPNELFWSDPNNQIGFINVSLASMKPEVGPPSLIIYLNLTFVMNDEYLYILAEWEDHSTMPLLNVDGLYFCWNINCPDFHSNYSSGMTSLPFGEPYGVIDGWGWASDIEDPGTEFDGIDNCYDESGRHSYPSDLKDVYFAYTYQPDNSYSVEIRRKLYTSQYYDVQFTQKKVYLFNMAIVDDIGGMEHAVSWTYALDLRDETQASNDGDDNDNNDKKEQIISGFFITLLLLSSFISITLVIYYLNNKKKLK